MGTWKQWLQGLIGAVIAAAANCVTVLIVDPAKFSPSADGGWGNLGLCVGVSAVVGAALFLKQNPTPWDGTERRSNPPAQSA